MPSGFPSAYRCLQNKIRTIWNEWKGVGWCDPMDSLTPWATRGQHLVYISSSHQPFRSFHTHTHTHAHTSTVTSSQAMSTTTEKLFHLRPHCTGSYLTFINTMKRNYFAYSFRIKPKPFHHNTKTYKQLPFEFTVTVFKCHVKFPP